MSLTRFLPTPSDRMGILWSLLPIEECVILEYGPAGTTHFSMGLFGEMDLETQNRLYTTHMSEADVVMGDVSRLEKAILEIDQNDRPKVIFVVASSVAAVIGVDLRGVCSYMQPQTKARLIAFEQGGFRGDYAIGLKETYAMLAETLPREVSENDKREDTFNLLGASMWSYRARSDIWELTSVLEEGFGLKKKVCLCADTSIGEIEEMGEAGINLVISSLAVPAAEKLKERFGTPWILRLPYGYQETWSWLKEIEKQIKKPLCPDLERRLREKMQMTMQYQMYGRMLREDKMRAAVMGEYDTVKGISRFLESLGFLVEHKICAHSLRGIENPDGDIRYLSTEKEKIDLMKSLHRTLVLADDTMTALCAEDNTCVRISSPVTKGMAYARHLPFAGIRGADYLLEFVEQYYQTLR